MKRFICLALSLLMVLSLGTLTAFAADAGPSLGNVQHVNDSDMTIDAQNTEPAWANALTLPIGFAYQPSAAADSTVSGTVSLLWSDTAIYAYYAISDSTIIVPTSDTQTASPWMTDSVELMIDVPDLNSTTASNGGLAAFQNRIDRTGFKSSWYATTNMASAGTLVVGSACDSIFTSAERSDDANHIYYVELKLPLSGLTVGAKIGLQAQLNDEGNTTPGDDHSVYNLTANNPAGSWMCDQYGYITLDSTSATPAAGNGAATTSPQTGDNGLMVFVIAAGVALSAVFVVTRKIRVGK